jgi:hypothetical protein
MDMDKEETNIIRMEVNSKNMEQGLNQNCSLGGGKSLVPEHIMEDLEEEEISRFQVMSLLSEMKMIGENAENIW